MTQRSRQGSGSCIGAVVNRIGSIRVSINIVRLKMGALRIRTSFWCTLYCIYIYIYIDVDYKGFGSTIGSEPLEPEPESLQYLLAEWIHFTLFGIIVPTIKLKV